MIRKIKVLHTEWSDGWGGQEIRILGEMLAVRERGVDVFLACRENAQIKERAQAEGIRVFTLPFRGNVDVITLGSLIGIIRRYRIDIVNTHSGKDTWVGGLAAKIAGAKFIRTRHLSNPINPSRFNFINSLADFLITTGESVRKQMIQNNRIDPDKIRSIPTGVDSERFNPHCCDRGQMRQKFGIKEDMIAIGTVAVLRSFKRHDLFLKAAKELTDHYDNLHFFIAGEGPQRKKIEELIQSLHLEKHVTMTGHLEHPEELLKALDIFVLSSDSKEGVPQSIIQAMMTNLPVVATDVGSTRDLYTEGGMILVPPASPEALKNAIATLIQNEDLRQMLPEVSAEHIKSFNQDCMIESILQVYTTLLD